MFGKLTNGVEQGEGLQTPIGIENDPALQLIVKSLVGEYPFAQIGVHVEEDVIDELQTDEYIVDAVSDGLLHEFGAQYPAGVEKFPKLHVIVNESVAVYPDKQVGIQVDPDNVGEGHDAWL